LRPSVRRRHRPAGQALVEFALVAPFLFLLLFGVIEGGRLVWTNHEVSNGTREGARFAMVRGANAATAATLSDVEAVVLDRTAGLDGARLTVNATNLGGEVGTTVVVSSTYQYQPIIGMIFGSGAITLSARSEVIIQY
jgi:Flp pilus assembly protein TadG